jgi:hypothetical protein
MSFSATFDCAVINEDLLNFLMGCPEDRFWKFTKIISVPARKHKKRRIQKKWIKRYGTINREESLGNFKYELKPNGAHEFTRVNV